ncbi:MAG: hypothetical protein P8Y58_09790 [Novosphingobium sp.]
MIEQRAGQHAHLAGCEGVIGRLAYIGVPPLPVGREEACQPRDRPRIEAKPSRVGQRQRTVEVEPDMTRAPCIVGQRCSVPTLRG